jgi:hypothetical protein
MVTLDICASNAAVSFQTFSFFWQFLTPLVLPFPIPPFVFNNQARIIFDEIYK